MALLPQAWRDTAQAMSQENLETFSRAWTALERRDVEGTLEELDPEVEWHTAFTALLGGEATVYRGHEGARDVIQQFWEVFSESQFDLSEIRDLGDRVLAIGTMRARGAESGVAVESPWAYLVGMRNGKALSVRAYADPAEALEAAGLSE